jgi:hypothetical protein
LVMLAQLGIHPSFYVGKPDATTMGMERSRPWPVRRWASTCSSTIIGPKTHRCSPSVSRAVPRPQVSARGSWGRGRRAAGGD